jgi:hypothetical protein
LYGTRQRNALDAAREELRDLCASTLLHDAARFFTPRAATAATATPASTTGSGGQGFVAGTGVASATFGRSVFILVFGLALGDGIDVRARPEAPIRVSRAMLCLRLHGAILPQLAFGLRERLPYFSCGGVSGR